MNAQSPDRMSRILIEGLDVDQILDLPDEHVATLMAVGPILFRVGSAEVLGQVRLHAGSLLIELAQIDGGGEGVLMTLWRLAERFAKQRRLDAVEWIVHAVSCAQPNLKLQRVLEKRGFEIRNVDGFGLAYYLRHRIDHVHETPDAPTTDVGRQPTN